jgi:hypothetical protein
LQFVDGSMLGVNGFLVINVAGIGLLDLIGDRETQPGNGKLAGAEE